METKTLEERVVDKLLERGLTITTAESCTGGLLAGQLINVPGVSECLKEAYVTYCDAAKHKLLGVSNQTLEKYTAVSRETASEMADGGAKAAGANICLSVTGIAGPGHDSEEFPAGLVYIGCHLCGETTAERFLFSGSRMEVRRQAVCEALKLLLRKLEEQQ